MAKFSPLLRPGPLAGATGDAVGLGAPARRFDRPRDGGGEGCGQFGIDHPQVPHNNALNVFGSLHHPGERGELLSRHSRNRLEWPILVVASKLRGLPCGCRGRRHLRIDDEEVVLHQLSSLCLSPDNGRRRELAGVLRIQGRSAPRPFRLLLAARGELDRRPFAAISPEGRHQGRLPGPR